MKGGYRKRHCHTLTRTTGWSLIVMLLALPGSAAGQGVTPNSHWGANLIPELDYRVDATLQFIGFTQYGKEVIPGTTDYTFRPYNDIDRTLGFNVLSVTRTAPSKTFPITENLVQVRTAYSVGVINDAVTEFFQNDLAHWCKRCGERLRRVPRELGDTEESTSRGPASDMPIVQFSQEYFFRPEERDRVGGQTRSKPSDVFAGGGYSIGTVNQEAFVHLGTNPRGIEYNGGGKCILDAACIMRINVGGIARAGILAKGYHLTDLTSNYGLVQGVLHTRWALGGFPLTLEAGLTHHTGFFAEPRTPLDSTIVEEREAPASSLYHLKRPKQERFISYRLRMGGFTFEYVNDEVGGKDKGPSFGVMAGFDFSKTDYAACQIAGYSAVAKAAESDPNWFEKMFASVRRSLECF